MKRNAFVGAVLVAVIVSAWFVSIGLAIAIAVVAALAVMSAIITTPTPDIAVHGLGSSKYQTDSAPLAPPGPSIDSGWGLGGGDSGIG